MPDLVGEIPMQDILGQHFPSAHINSMQSRTRCCPVVGGGWLLSLPREKSCLFKVFHHRRSDDATAGAPPHFAPTLAIAAATLYL